VVSGRRLPVISCR